jgi:protein ImuB
MPRRRIACVALPEIRVELARERESAREAPLAVIVARPGGAVKTERDVLGNTKIDFVSREALSLGLCPGQTVASARATCARLRVRVVGEGTVHSALARVAEVLLAFGPTTAFDIAQDVVWVEVTGCAHLYGGEIALAKAIDASVRRLGHVCRVALAEGPRIAAAVARFSAHSAEPLVIPGGKEALAVSALPIAALALDDDVTAWLADLGLSRCGDLQKLPRRALGTRLRNRVHDVMPFLDGRDHAPLEAWRPPELPEERLELEWEAQSIEALAFVMKTLCDRLEARIHGRALAVSRLEIELSLDRARCAPDESGSGRLSLSIALPSPISRADDLLAVVRTRLERCSLAAPVLAVTLRATELAQHTTRTLDLLTPEPKAHGALPRLVAELCATLGERAIGTLSLVDTWSPTERTRLVPFGAPTTAPRHALVTSALEPSRLVHSVRVPREALVGAWHLARLESVEWWKRPAHRYDLFAAWLGDALAWLEVCPIDDSPLLRGWID